MAAITTPERTPAQHPNATAIINPLADDGGDYGVQMMWENILICIVAALIAIGAELGRARHERRGSMPSEYRRTTSVVAAHILIRTQQRFVAKYTRVFARLLFMGRQRP
jgi:hypothetical protein